MDKAQLTMLIIDNIIKWYRQLDYQTSQIPMGHEYFISYTKKLDKSKRDI